MQETTAVCHHSPVKYVKYGGIFNLGRFDRFVIQDSLELYIKATVSCIFMKYFSQGGMKELFDFI